MFVTGCFGSTAGRFDSIWKPCEDDDSLTYVSVPSLGFVRASGMIKRNNIRTVQPVYYTLTLRFHT